MIPLHVLMDVEQTPIIQKDEERLYPEQLLNLNAIGVLTDGTDKGNPVVIVRVDLPTGEKILAQTTLRLMQAAIRAFTARYGEV
jgi:hypothetical protein